MKTLMMASEFDQRLLCESQILWFRNAHSLQDDDPYVRKTAAVCVAKLFDINPELVEDRGFLDLLKVCNIHSWHVALAGCNLSSRSASYVHGMWRSPHACSARQACGAHARSRALKGLRAAYCDVRQPCNAEKHPDACACAK